MSDFTVWRCNGDAVDPFVYHGQIALGNDLFHIGNDTALSDLFFAVRQENTKTFYKSPEDYWNAKYYANEGDMTEEEQKTYRTKKDAFLESHTEWYDRERYIYSDPRGYIEERRAARDDAVNYSKTHSWSNYNPATKTYVE